MRLPTLLLLVAWVAGLLAVTVGALAPDGYAIYVLMKPEPQPFPYAMVAQFLVVVTVEALALTAIIRPKSFQRSWRRGLLALLLSLGLAFAHGLTLMHASPYMVWHVRWLFAVSIGLALATTVSAMSAARIRRLPQA